MARGVAAGETLVDSQRMVAGMAQIEQSGQAGRNGQGGRRIGLVAAAQRRRAGVRQAREQFASSPTFRRARDYCERAYGEWYILSASHVLLPPQQVIGPDELRLSAFTADERLTWAAQVAERLRQRRDRSAEPLTFVLFASHSYAKLLMRAAPELSIELPLRGLAPRDRLRWYDERLRVGSRLLGGGPDGLAW